LTIYPHIFFINIPSFSNLKYPGNCCCDYRRAVIIVSILYIFSDVIGIICFGSGYIIICFYVFTLIAAVRYNIWMLGIAVFLILIGFSRDMVIFLTIVVYNTEEIPALYSILVSVNIFINLAGLYIVPVVGLIFEIKSERNYESSRETYPREGK
jgi:hypothetical protein